MEKIFGLIAVAVSLFGYISFLTHREHKPEISLGITFSLIGSVMFLAGIAGILQAGAVALCAGGWMAFFSELKNRRIGFIRSAGFIFFLAVSVYLLAVHYNSRFWAYDNFSHWAEATKVLIRYGRFPTAEDTNIQFVSYPPGSAAFIYFFTYISGISAEWFQAWIQAVLTLGMFTGICALAKNKAGHICAMICVMILLCSNTAPWDLLVDTLLPAVAVSGYALIRAEKLPKKGDRYLLIPYLIFLTSIKNSGLFFAAVLIVYDAVFHPSCRRRYAVLFGASVLLALGIWKLHVAAVFPEGETSVHAFSLVNYQGVFSGKTHEEILNTWNAWLKKEFSVENRGLLLPILLLVRPMSALLFRDGAETRKRLFRTAGIHCAVLAIYAVGLLLMYLFSMKGDASGLGGYDRYHRTINAFIVGICFADFLREPWGANIRGILTALLLLALSWLSILPYPEYLWKQDTNNSRYLLDSMIESYQVPKGKRYLLLQDDDRGKLMYIGRYLLDSRDVTVRKTNIIHRLDFSNYDYLIILQPSDRTRKYTETNFHSTDPVIRLVVPSAAE